MAIKGLKAKAVISKHHTICSGQRTKGVDRISRSMKHEANRTI